MPVAYELSGEGYESYDKGLPESAGAEALVGI